MSTLGPQSGPQSWLVSCPFFEVFYGGGSGSGKSFGMLLDWLSHSNQYGESARGYIFRRTNDEINETLLQCKQLFGKFAKYIPHRRQWTFKNGAVLKLRYLTQGDNVDKFMNLEYSWLAIDQVTDWPSETPVLKLKAALINSNTAIPKRFLVTGETGGKGHLWAKKRYIDRQSMVPWFDEECGQQVITIWATIDHNPLIKVADPHYIKRLYQRLPEWLADAKIEANWDLEGREGQLRDVPEFGVWLKKVTPAFSWDWPHLMVVREALGRIVDGSLKKLMIFMPPRHGKSNLATIRFPAWYLEKFPDMRVIVGAYNQTLANKFSRQTRKIAQERLSLNKERTAVEDWETEEGGGLRAVGVGGGITGQGGNLIIIDDPVKNREEANSLAYRERCWDWYTDDLSTRMEPGAAIVLIMTRWHEDDLAGRILASEDGPNWEVINLPAICEALPEDEDTDRVGRVEGQALCPERYDEKALDGIKRVLGNSFQALYQQRPSAVEGEIWKREYWKFYKELPMKEAFICVHSWDTAFKKGERNDPSNCTIWLVFKHGIYLVYRWNEKVESPELKRQVKTVATRFPPTVVLIEDKASGQSLIQELKRETRLPIIPFKVDGTDKESRANTGVITVEAGNVYLPEDAPWLTEYLDQMAAFPNATHDEDSDTTSQALIWIQNYRRKPSRMVHLNFMGR